MKVIGRGKFTTCYKKTRSTVFLKSVCPFKELLSLGWIESPWFPKVKRVDYMEYEMKYYPKVRSIKNNLSKEHHKAYKELRRLYLDHCIPKTGFENISKYKELFEKVSIPSLREGLLEAITAMSNYDSIIAFEISPRNVSVHNGKLLLLDCFFFPKKADEVDRLRAQKINIFDYYK